MITINEIKPDGYLPFRGKHQVSVICKEGIIEIQFPDKKHIDDWEFYFNGSSFFSEMYVYISDLPKGDGKTEKGGITDKQFIEFTKRAFDLYVDLIQNQE